MKLGIIVNCAGYDKECNPANIKLMEEVFPELEKLDIEVNLIMPNSDWIKTQADKHTKNLTSQSEEAVERLLNSKNNKGIIVKDCIQEFIEDDCRAVLHIDGSGKFDLKDIVSITQMILDPPNQAILTKRDISGMIKFRTLLEDFERQRILNKYPYAKILDGQSGCWAFKLFNGFKSGYITAKGYEIELDILINILEFKLNIAWLPIKIKNTKVTNFTFDANIQKIEWLSKRLEIRKEEILKSLKIFQSKNTIKILEAEKEAKELGLSECTFSNYAEHIEKSENFF
ncbi:MAG: hypothetical protein AABX63_05955 [Nanoarchaeota archaeon]